jgi:hypothetical protein
MKPNRRTRRSRNHRAAHRTDFRGLRPERNSSSRHPERSEGSTEIGWAASLLAPRWATEDSRRDQGRVFKMLAGHVWLMRASPLAGVDRTRASALTTKKNLKTRPCSVLPARTDQGRPLRFISSADATAWARLRIRTRRLRVNKRTLSNSTGTRHRHGIQRAVKGVGIQQTAR